MSRSIGEIVAPIFADALSKATELHGVQVLLGACRTDAERKLCIMEWHAQGHLDDEQTRLLLEAHMLEAA